jgi:uncharacterized protein (TIGR02246 family)
MPARNPEEVDALFEKALNAGDLEGLVSLYEPNATLVNPDGPATGHEAIRASYQAFIGMKPEIGLKVEKTVRAGDDLAMCYGVWSMTAGDQKMTGKTIEVVRRQPDGTWLFAIDDPWARGT